ncbi:MAG: SdiA-regulated domain-containing protein, partial [Bacteroidota bacterium]
LAQCPKSRKHDKIVSFIYDQGGYALGPSAIAIHPKSGQLFVTSSAGRLIVILSQQGEIHHIRRLDKDFFPQPEGLAFAPDGTLYISTEAKHGAPARIYQVAYQPGFTGL